ncbi:MAG: hypothetical protein JXR96_27830 [Deltaproteobacteria bacterium]|nr:hypothetical protein [Deltaproteobacteria bacterium]
MAFLRKDRCIIFESVAEFLNHYDSHITKGGFYLDSHLNWPLRKQAGFQIRIEDSPESTAGFVAEVVFCGGGKVGLEMDLSPRNRANVINLVNSLRTSPVLQEDGTILYGSATKFQQDYEANVASGGIYLESSRKWPLGRKMTFLIKIQGLSFDLPIQATPVFSEGGLTCLQLEADEATRQSIAAFMAKARSTIPRQAPEEPDEPEPEPAEPLVEMEGLREEFETCRGTIYSPRDPTEFQQLQHFKLDPRKHHDTNLFDLVASICDLERDVELAVKHAGSEMCFQFNKAGKLVGYDGPDADKGLLECLAANRSISPEVKDELIGQAGPYARAADLVLGKGAATPSQIMIAVAEQTENAFETIRAAGEVLFELRDCPTYKEEGTTFAEMIIPWMERGLKALDVPQIKTLLKPLWNRYPKLSSKPIYRLADLDLDDDEYDFVKSLEGKTTLPQAMADFPKKLRDRLMRLAISLRAIGSVVALSEPGAEEPAPAVRKAAAPAARGAGPAAKSPRPGSGSTEAQLAAELRELEESGTKFDLLGIHWTAHPNMYPLAMREIELKYGQGSNLQRLSEKAAELCRQRLQLARRAAAELQDDHRRIEYRKSVVPYNTLKTTAQILSQKADTELVKRNLAGAVELLEMAIELYPAAEFKYKLEQVRKRERK